MAGQLGWMPTNLREMEKKGLIQTVDKATGIHSNILSNKAWQFAYHKKMELVESHIRLRF